MRAIKPLALIRWNLITAAARDWVQWAVVGALAAGLVALASWQAASWEAGLWVCGGFAVVAVVLHGVGRALVRLIQPLGAGARFAVRHAILNLARPGNQTRVILLAVGLGSFFVIGIHAVQANLLGAFALEIREDSPDMFLIDIQQDQRDGVRELLEERIGSGAANLIPVLRARVTGVDGQRTQLDSARAVRRRGAGREFTVTYRDRLEANERVVDGAFWGAGGPRRARGLGGGEHPRPAGPGDGRRAAASGCWGATSGRRYRAYARSTGTTRAAAASCSSSAPGSSTGPLTASSRSCADPRETTARARLQRDLVAGFPNVSVIDGLEVIATVRRILDYVTLAITMVGGIAIFSGVLILVGSVAMTKYQRRYETAIFQTLGATRRSLVTMLVVEYGTLGVLAGAVGSVGALGLTWGLSRYLLEVDWDPGAAGEPRRHAVDGAGGGEAWESRPASTRCAASRWARCARSRGTFEPGRRTGRPFVSAPRTFLQSSPWCTLRCTAPGGRPPIAEAPA